jgi:membrane-bound ClpP family serine protease
MEPLVGGGVTDEIQTFLAFIVGKKLRAPRQRNVNALCPIDASRGKVFVEGEYWSATSDTFVKEGEPVQIIAVEGLTTKVKPET